MIEISDNDDKVKSKSLEEEMVVDYYDKIVNKEPLPEESLIENFAEELSKIPPNNFELNTTVLTKKSGQVQRIKESVKRINNELLEFKDLFMDYIKEEYVLEDCEVRLTDDSINIYSNKFYVETIRKVNKITDKWCIFKEEGSGSHYSLNLRIELEDVL